MTRYKITKIIEFCYGHRLMNHKGKCRFLHGHNARIEVEMKADKLDPNGMVADFGDIRDKVKEWVDANLDHKMLLCKQDPMVKVLKDSHEPCFVMDENPTAENIAKLIFQQMKKINIAVSEIRLWETPSSYASYRMEK